MKRSTITILVIAALLVLAIIAYQIVTRTSPVEVETATVKTGEVRDVVSASGKVEANRLIPIVGTFADKVTEILVKEGDDVEEDQELIGFDRFPKINSPITGKVVKIDAQLDQIVAPGVPLVTIADMNPTFIAANVDETDIGKIKAGQTVNISLDAYPQARVKGEITEVGLVAVPTQTGGTAFPVKVRVTSTDGAVLRVGMSADVDIIVATYPNVVTIPMDAVTSQDGKDVVFVVEGSLVKRKAVKLGLLSDDVYEVKSGLTLGEKVVVKGLDKVSDGVRVIEKKPSS
ncbi:MAG: efflux RND transporter periplasmic adaptor subunit [Actinomycetota bacterium]